MGIPERPQNRIEDGRQRKQVRPTAESATGEWRRPDQVRGGLPSGFTYAVGTIRRDDVHPEARASCTASSQVMPSTVVR